MEKRDFNVGSTIGALGFAIFSLACLAFYGAYHLFVYLQKNWPLIKKFVEEKYQYAKDKIEILVAKYKESQKNASSSGQE